MKTLKIFCYVLAILSCSITKISAQCGQRFIAEIFEEAQITTVAYGENITEEGDSLILEMDVYEPIGDLCEDRPLVVFMPGFLNTNKQDTAIVHFCKSLIRRGYVVAALDYRRSDLADYFNMTTGEENMIKDFFKGMQDGKAALRYFTKTVQEENIFKIDTNQVFIGSFDYGALIAMNIAYMDEEDVLTMPEAYQEYLEEVGGLEGQSGHETYDYTINAVVNISGAILDTAFIDANEPTIISFHEEEISETSFVPYVIGQPLGFDAFPIVYGSYLIDSIAVTKGLNDTSKLYNYTYNPFSNDNTIVAESTILMDETAQFLAKKTVCHLDSTYTEMLDTIVITYELLSDVESGVDSIAVINVIENNQFCTTEIYCNNPIVVNCDLDPIAYDTLTLAINDTTIDNDIVVITYYFVEVNDSILTIHAELTLNTAIPELIEHKEGIHIYPNPVINTLIIENYELTTKPHHYYLYNQMGQICQSGIIQDTQTQIDRNGLSTGIYFLRIEQEESIEIHKLLFR